MKLTTTAWGTIGAIISIMAGFIYIGAPWWYYVLLVLAAICGFLFVLYRGYEKLKPTPLATIPCPPLSHPVLGHPDLLMSPYRHLMRSETMNKHDKPLHQLVFMKTNTVSVDDGVEAAKILRNVPLKGQPYAVHRYDKDTPCLFSADGQDYELRNQHLRPALVALKINQEISESIIGRNLGSILTKFAENKRELDMKVIAAYLAYDCLCSAAFGYQVNATLDAAAGTTVSDGPKLFNSMQVLLQQGASQGLYATGPGVDPERVSSAREIWKDFFKNLIAHIHKEDNEENLNIAERFDHALLALAKENPDVFKEHNISAEVANSLRHGFETLSGTICWMFYALSANPKHLVELEKAIKAHQATPGVPYPEYVECVVKETLRRYPVLGNFVIRTADQPEVTIECKIPDSEDLIHEYKIPEGTTISVHIWSLQNTVREWTDPNEFNPSRWLESKDDAEPTCPKCPFIKSLSGKASAYEGLGHKEGSVSFLPFSAGARSCPSKTFVVDVLCSILLSVCSRFRLDVSEKDNFTNLPKEDPGVAMGTCIVPVLPTSCMMKVFTEGLCEMPVKEKKSNYLVEEDDYVVADEDDEVPDLGE